MRPYKEKKLVRANHAPYITKTLRKAIVTRSYLEKVYFKKRTPNSLIRFKKQKNYCSSLYKIKRRQINENSYIIYTDSNELSQLKKQ